MMRIPRVSLNISVIITLLLVALPINVVSAAGETFGTGLNAPTAAQTAWMKQNFPIIQKVNLNSLALQRINTERQKNGKSQVSSSSIMLAPMGQEASFTASAAPADTVGDTGPNTVSLPGSVDNSTSSAFPPIRSQGSIGSCAAWATTYYQFTYETNLARGRTASSGDNSNIFSPKWTYDLVNGGQDAGSSFSDCYQVEMKNGAASWAAFPYDTNYLAWPLAGSTWLDALNYRPQTWGQIYNSDVDQEISAIKTQLANGHVLVIGTYVYSWVQKTVGNDPATTDDDAFAGQKIAAYMNGASGGHGMTIVGYNDSIWCDLNGNGVVDSGEKGAFKIANSWGTSDWNSGYRWVSYDAVRQASAVAAYGSWPTSDRYSGGIFCNGTVYSLTVSASYAPSLVAEVTLNAANRGQMVVSLGTSSAVVSQPTTIWYPRALDSTGGNLAFDGTTTACDGTFDIDFSDLTAQYPSNTRWCVGVLDSATGNVTTLKSFKLYQYGILAATASDTPKTADNQQIYDWVTYTLNTVTPSSDATLSNLIISSGTLTPSFTASNISYTASINNSVSTVTVTPTVNQANATVKVNGTAVNSGTASGNINMAVGANTITVAVTAQDTTTVKTYTIVVTRAAAPSSDATLSNLVISSGTLTPSFTASNISYTASINNNASTVTVTPTVNQANATVKVNGTAVNSGTASGNINMAVGANTITVAVTAQDATTVKTYTIVVTRAAAPSSDATLSNLVISSGTLTPSFTASNISYTASINNSVSTVTVTPTVNQANATVKVNGTAVNSGTASGNINMAVGANTITVAVTAQDTTTVKTYTIVVTRAAAPSSDATLSNLVISSGTLTPSFTASNISYTASINNSVSTVTVTPTVNQANATVKVNGTAVNSGTASGNINMAVGANTITVAVTAQDTTTVKTYTIVVTRAVNTPPVAVADTGVTTKNHVLNTSAPGVLANDTDVDGNTLTAIKVTDPAHGTLMLNSNGSYTYTPATGFVGTDSFTYKANDSVVDSNVVIVAITVVDDTPPAPPAPPAPPSGGGGGGGGFGGGAVVKKTTPGVADIASIIDAKGLFTDGVTGLSEDNQAVIRIESGTTAAAADGAPFSQITIKKQNEIDNLPKDVIIVGETYDFGPTGVTFSPAVTIRLSYNPRNLPEGVSESGLVIGYYDDKSGNWYSLDSTVDLTGRNVYTQTTHFSTYAILSGPTATQPLAAQVSAPVTPPVEPAVQTVPMPMNIATTPPASDVTWSTPAQTVSSVSPEDNAPATPAIPVSPEPLISSTQPVTTEAAITTTTTALDNTISGTTAGTEISADVHAGNKVPLFVLVLTSVIIGMIGTVVFIRRS